MLRYIIRRVLFLIPVLLGVAFCVFTLLYLTPGDPARMVLGDMATDEAIKEFRDKEGLNDPFLVQFGNYVWKAINGDIGRSYSSRRPVMKELLTAFPYTLKLSAFAMIIAILIGIPCGIISAIKQYSWFDTITMIFAMVGLSMPVFWLGLLLILLFSVHLRWLPSSGFSTFKAMILPSVALAAQSISMVTRMTRSSMLEVVRADYIRTARAKGQKESIVIWVHALRNALFPILTAVGQSMASLLSGAIVVETVFNIPGLGQLLINSIARRDFAMIQGIVLVVTVICVLVNLLVDLLYGVADPRVRLDKP